MYRNAVRGDQAMATSNMHKKFGDVRPCGFELYEWTDRQITTNRHTHHNSNQRLYRECSKCGFATSPSPRCGCKVGHCHQRVSMSVDLSILRNQMSQLQTFSMQVACGYDSVLRWRRCILCYTLPVLLMTLRFHIIACATRIECTLWNDMRHRCQFNGGIAKVQLANASEGAPTTASSSFRPLPVCWPMGSISSMGFPITVLACSKSLKCTVLCCGHRVGHGSLFCDPIRPDPRFSWPDPTQ